MADPTPTARRQADEARADVFILLSEIQRRVMPSTIVKEGLDAVRDKASAVRDKAGDAAIEARLFAERKPAAAAGIAGAAVIALAWYPLRRLLTRRRASDDPPASL